MVNKFRYLLAKSAGKLAVYAAKLGSGEGTILPGYVFANLAGYDALTDLSHELAFGSIVVTGTNGKTTTTTLLTRLLAQDVNIKYSYESNTINAIATALLNQNGDLGVFEYGIRDVTHGIPDKVQKYLDPVGVLYTTISREHTQVKGIKNSFDDYVKAKSLLTENMNHGVVIVNADDPITANIGLNKTIKVNYFGIECDKIRDMYKQQNIECPNCGATLEYSHRIMNHRGYYSCSCGFKRPLPNVRLTNIEFNAGSWILTIEGDLYNYTNKKDIDFEVEITVPEFGFHNVYNTLASITAYATFTPKIGNIVFTIQKVFNNLDMSFIPPGRFEVVDVNGKKVGLGQGDNGDAAKINGLFMKQYVEGPLEFIYTTPDVGEEEIFEDHLETIRGLNPDHLIVVPGRTSSEIAEKYYNQIKDEFPSVFYPLQDMHERIEKLVELAINSNYDYVIMTGCGEEQAMWEKIKQKLINQ